MSLTVAIVIIVVLVVALLAMLTGMMSLPRHMTKHRPRGGRPSARMRWFARRRRDRAPRDGVPR